MEKSKEFLEQEKMYKEVAQMESEIESLRRSINTIGNTKDYWNVFPLSKEDLKALIDVRIQKIEAIQKGKE